MATFEIEAGGKTFEVEAADLQTAQAAFKRFSSGASPSTSAPAQSAGEMPSYDALGNPTGATETVNAAASMPYGEQMTNVGGALDSGARQLVKGIPVLGGAADKFAAAGDAATYSFLGRGADGSNFFERYDQNLTKERATDAAFEAAHPNLATGLNVAGGVTATLPLAATNLGARALGMVGSTGARVAQGAAGGAAIGAGDAATRGNDILTSGGVGSVMGGGFPLLGRTAGAVVERFARGPTPEALQGFQPKAVDKVSRALTDDAVDPAALQRLGPDAMLMDAGPNLRLQGEALATQPGSASRIIGDAVTERHNMAGPRITDSVDNALGPYRNFRDTQNAAVATRRASGNALYGQAFDQAGPVDVSAALQSIDNIVPSQLARRGAPDPNSIEAALINVRDRLSSDAGRRVDARQLHTIKMDLDDSIESAIRNGRSNQANVLIDVRNRVVDGLDNATGGADGLYANARRQFRSDSAVINALDDGRSLFSKATRPDDVVALVREMSDAERQAFRIGARDAIDEVMGNVRNDALAARNLFSKDWNQQKLSAVVGREYADRLLHTIERETRFAETYGAVQRGSQTRGRQAAGAEFPNSVAPVTLPGGDRTMLGTVEQGIRGIARLLGTQSRQAGLDRQSADAARLLSTTGGHRDRVVQALMDSAAQRQRIQPLADAMQDIATLIGQSGSNDVRRRVQR